MPSRMYAAFQMPLTHTHSTTFSTANTHTHTNELRAFIMIYQTFLLSSRLAGCCCCVCIIHSEINFRNAGKYVYKNVSFFFCTDREMNAKRTRQNCTRALGRRRRRRRHRTKRIFKRHELVTSCVRIRLVESDNDRNICTFTGSLFLSPLLRLLLPLVSAESESESAPTPNVSQFHIALEYVFFVFLWADAMTLQRFSFSSSRTNEDRNKKN